MTIKKITTKDKILLIASAIIFIVIAVFVIAFWDTTYEMLTTMLNGVEYLQDRIQSLGIIGVIAMMLIMILCFFFPFISSMPIQVACGISYGIPIGGTIILISFIISTQLLYLLRQNIKVFSSLKQIEKRQELEKLISESNRSIYFALILAYLLPGIPFLVISNLAASGLKYPKYTMVTILGMIPDILTTIFVGEKLLSSSAEASVITLFAIIIIIVLSVIFNDKLIKWVFTSKKKDKK